ncbi:oligosaccharide flippase family protein [Ferruginibacter lapsinanis]|uniref:lipopolysaccharide biosynthesis protein n=1 Tax=Ferruginibacter lapsinanis TaxID=563172 RepID=UPI001E5540DA|nr:oligosaccharide flippase family protein [Ferruginibacter lapsinanis]UEG50565.1 oligosaccharide flippase family protein [Ferruginibacter lapsinanis]
MTGFSNILKNVQTKISNSFFTNTHQRDKSVFKNVGIGFASKGVSIFLSFLQIPITLSILSKTEYGIWLTLFSITSWMAYFDLGLGNGLRNKLTEALAERDLKKGKVIVSTTYVTLSAIFLFFVVLFTVIALFIPWAKVLNTTSVPDNELLILVYCCFIGSLLNFVANLIQTVFAANHLTGKGNILSLFNQIIILVTTLVIKYMHLNNAFLLIGIILSVTPLLVNVVASIYYYTSRFKEISPNIKFFKRSYLREVMSVGLKFFVIQVAVLIIFSTDNFLITQLYAPSEVASYNFVYKYFSVIALFFSIIAAPLWTMYTDAYKKNDISWIENNIKRMLRLFFFAVIGVLLMTICSNFLLTLWLGKVYSSSMIFVFFIGLYTLQTVWNNIFVLPLNAIGKLNLQMGLAIWAAVINIPLAIFLSKIMGDVLSIVIANILSLLVGSVVSYIQFYKELKMMKIQKVHSGL